MSKFTAVELLLPHLAAFAYVDAAMALQQLVVDLLMQSLVDAVVIVRQMDQADRRHED